MIYNLYLVVPDEHKDHYLTKVSNASLTSNNSNSAHMFSIKTRQGTSFDRTNNSSAPITQKAVGLGVPANFYVSLGDIVESEISYDSALATFFTPEADKYVHDKNLPEIGDEFVDCSWSTTTLAAKSTVMTINGKNYNMIHFMKFTMQHEDDTIAVRGRINDSESVNITRNFDRIRMFLKFHLTVNEIVSVTPVELYFNSADAYADGEHSFFSIEDKPVLRSFISNETSLPAAPDTLTADADVEIVDSDNDAIGTIKRVPIDGSDYSSYYIDLTVAYSNYIQGLDLSDSEKRTLVMNNVRDLVRMFNDTTSTNANSIEVGEFDFDNNRVFIVGGVPFDTALDGKMVRVINAKSPDNYVDLGNVNGEYGIYADLDTKGEKMTLNTGNNTTVVITNMDETLGRPQLRYFDISYSNASGNPVTARLVNDASYININYNTPLTANVGGGANALSLTDTKLSFSYLNKFTSVTTDTVLNVYNTSGESMNGIVEAKVIYVFGSVQQFDVEIKDANYTWRDLNGQIVIYNGSYSSITNVEQYKLNITSFGADSLYGTALAGSLNVQNRVYESRTVIQMDDIFIILGSVTADQVANADTVFATTYSEIIAKMINDSLLKGDTNSVQSTTLLGDPHVYTFNNKRYALSPEEKEWNYYSDENVEVTMKTRKLTEKESEAIVTYYKQMTGKDHIHPRLVTNGVFMNEVCIKSGSQMISYNYDAKLFNLKGKPNVKYGEFFPLPESLKLKYELNQNVTAGKVLFRANNKNYLLLLCTYENPQMKYGFKLIVDSNLKNSKGLSMEK
jgi:hypothetical protein